MSHAERAAAFVADAARMQWHDRALWFVRASRDRAVDDVPEWEALREAAAQIKRHTLANLADLLETFEANAERLGVVVHWAADAAEHNETVLRILREHAVTRVVKSKSMLTEECGLNAHLEARGIEVVDTDLGERIVQLRGEPPSHIVMPAIHLKKEEVGELFHAELGTEKGENDPRVLALAARRDLRRRFLEAEAGITGVNFGIAETGGFVVVTNEGNADLGTALPKLHIASMGIEKLIPGPRDLAVFLRLLARSATGQALSAYTSHFHGPPPGGALHLVLVDNGRSELLARPHFRRSLACIRCGACLNTCPVYRRSGGHSYESTIPGPIGSILGPARDPETHAGLPHACTLCGSCTDVCPVKIDLHHQLLAFRGELVARGHSPRTRAAARLAAFALSSPRRYSAAGRLLRALLRHLPRSFVHAGAGAWARQRELPTPPDASFRALWARRTR